MGQGGRGHNGSSGANPLLKGIVLEHIAQNCVQIVPPRKRDSTTALGNQSLHRKEVPPLVQVELAVCQFVPIASCPVSWHH